MVSTRSAAWIAIRAFFYVGLILGALVGVVPALIDDLVPGRFFHLGLALLLVGMALYSRTTWEFILVGRGTPLPLDPPRALVVRGPYRIVRNPMAVGFTLILVGEAIAFGSAGILAYAAALWVAIHLFVVLVEEPDLRSRFGASYDWYRETVPRWLPRFPALGKNRGASAWGWAWVALTFAFGLHVVDEAANDFLSVYNPVVLAIRERYPVLVFPTFGFGEWLTMLIIALAALLFLSPLAFRGVPALRLLAFPYAVIMFLNGANHIAWSLYTGRPIAGVWSSPLLLITSTALFITTKRRAGSRVGLR